MTSSACNNNCWLSCDGHDVLCGRACKQNVSIPESSSVNVNRDTMNDLSLCEAHTTGMAMMSDTKIKETARRKVVSLDDQHQ